MVILIHPSSLFSEGLSRILSDTPFQINNAARTLEGLQATTCDPANEQLFIIGGRDATNIVKDVQEIAVQFQLARIVVIGDRIDMADVLAALEAGARGYLGENVTREALLKSLELVMLDKTVLPGDFGRNLPKHVTHEKHLPDCAPLVAHDDRTDNQKGPPLSVRETAILKTLALGLSNKIIARNLDITEATVKVHVKSILRKIRAVNRTQAAIWAVTHLTATTSHPAEPVWERLHTNATLDADDALYAPTEKKGAGVHVEAGQ
jgi:two-component system, NarL family, nitrate/nitrite response regulator NarL